MILISSAREGSAEPAAHQDPHASSSGTGSGTPHIQYKDIRSFDIGSRADVAAFINCSRVIRKWFLCDKSLRFETDKILKRIS